MHDVMSVAHSAQRAHAFLASFTVGSLTALLRLPVTTSHSVCSRFSPLKYCRCLRQRRVLYGLVPLCLTGALEFPELLIAYAPSCLLKSDWCSQTTGRLPTISAIPCPNMPCLAPCAPCSKIFLGRLYTLAASVLDSLTLKCYEAKFQEHL